METEYRDDPFRYNGKMKARTLKTIFSAMHESFSMINKFTAPWILIQGGLDKLVDVIFMMKIIARY